MSDITLVVSAPGPTVDLTADAPGAVTVTVESGGGVSSHAALPDLATSGHPASAIAFTPTGSIDATTVQAAVAEVATDAAAAYQPLDSDLTAIAALTTPATTISGAAQKASNLSDLTSASSARTNLGLGGAATLAVGTTAGTVAAGDDGRITGAVPKSTLTAKGDLLAATGSATPAALAVGTDGYVLTADAASTPGVKWAAPASGGGVQPSSAVVSGITYPIYPNGFSGHGGAPLGATNVKFTQWIVQQACTITQLWCEVTTQASAGNRASLGIYTASSTWVPTLLLDAGTVAVDSTGVKKITGLSQALTPGRYWLAIHTEANTSYRYVTSGAPFASGSATILNGTAQWVVNATFGSMPASPTPSITNSSSDAAMVFPVVTVP